jgi:hypothetical protein
MAGKKQGLGQPKDVGVDNLFDVEEQSEVGSTDKSSPVGTKSDGVDQDDQKVKTSLSLAPQIIDLLYDLKKAARKREGRFVSQSELIEWAVLDLAKKLNVLERDEK